MHQGKNRKNAKFALAERRLKVADLYCRGFSQVQIAKECCVSQGLISGDLSAIRKEWAASTIAAFDQKVGEELEKLRALECEAWRAWVKSCQDQEITQTEAIVGARESKSQESKDKKADQSSQSMSPLRQRIVKTMKGRTGDPRYLEQIERCIVTRLKLLGLLRGDQTTVNVVQAQTTSLEEILRMAGDGGRNEVNDMMAAHLAAVPGPGEPGTNGFHDHRPDTEGGTT